MAARMRMLFGRYKGCSLTDLPDYYLSWLVNGIPLKEPLASAVRAEWVRRSAQEQTSSNRSVPTSVPTLVDPDVILQVVDAGKRALSLRHHPDLAHGDGQKMLAVNVAADWLHEHLTEVFQTAGVAR